MSEEKKSSSGRWINWVVTAMVFVALHAWMTRGNVSPFMGEPAPPLSLAVAAGHNVPGTGRIMALGSPSENPNPSGSQELPRARNPLQGRLVRRGH